MSQINLVFWVVSCPVFHHWYMQDVLKFLYLCIGCKDLLYIWVDPELRGFVEDEALDYWLFRQTVEDWDNYTRTPKKLETSFSQNVSQQNKAIRKPNKPQQGSMKLVAS